MFIHLVMHCQIRYQEGVLNICTCQYTCQKPSTHDNDQCFFLNRVRYLSQLIASHFGKSVRCRKSMFMH